VLAKVMMSAEELQSTVNQLRAGKLLIKAFPSIYSTDELNSKLNQYDEDIRVLEQELERVKNNDTTKLKIQRTRYVILKHNRTEILCGLSRQFHFKKINDIGNAAIKTYNSYKKAEAAMECWSSSWVAGCEIVPITETIESDD